MKKYFFLLMITIFFANCKKDKNATSVSGQVVDATTSSPIPNATVYIQSRNMNCFSCNPGTFATINADANGKFSYSFDANKDLEYNVAASANNYFDDKSTDGVSIDSYKDNNIKVQLQPKAWIKVHVKNINPFDNYDLISVSGDWNHSNWINYYGTTIDTVIFGVPIVVEGNRDINNYWDVTKNSIKNSYSGKIYCTAFDTTLYNINY